MNSMIAFLCAGCAALLAAAAPAPAPVADKPLPLEEMATPAIDPAKLAGSEALRVQDVRNRVTSQNNLKEIGIAVANYAGLARDSLPTDVLDKDGKALLSWRVRLLPYLGEKDLYKQFKLDEPWDSKHNLPLVEKMPKVLTSPRVIVKRKGYTVYQVFSGPGALFQSGKKSKYKIGNIPDGTSQTVFAVESSKAVPWTKPADIPFDMDKDLPDFGKAYGNKPLGSLMDGSVRVLDLNKIKPETLKYAISPDDGNVLGEDWDN